MIEEKSDDGFWLGVGAGAVGMGLVLYGAWKLSEASYNRGWNGEALASQNSFGIFGWTSSGAFVLISSFKKGQIDYDAHVNLSNLRNSLKIIKDQTQDAIEKIQKIEYKIKEQPKIEISADETNFLKELHELAQTTLNKPQPHPTQRKSYIT